MKSILLALAGSAMTLSASLVPIGLVPSTGNGIGAVSTSIVFENSNQNGNPALVESGCVGILNGVETSSAAVCPSGFFGGDNTNPQAPSQKNDAYLTTELIGAGQTLANLVLLFNAIESDTVIRLDNIAVSLYSGADVVTFYYGGPAITFNGLPGQGNAGFGFQLDAAQSAQANAFVASHAGPTYIGTAANVSGGLSSGAESIALATISTVQNPLVLAPEPGTVVMMFSGLALAGIGAIRRRRV